MSEVPLTGQTVRIMFDSAPFGMCSVLTDGTVVRSNPAFREMLGGDASSLLGLVGPSDRVTVERALRSIASGAETMFRLDVPVQAASERWLELSGVAMRGGTGDVMVHVIDVTDRHLRERDLLRLAEHDQMTGLLNRASFHRAVGERLAARAGGTLVMVDLDGFKAVNDSRGHQVGDQVLIAVAKTLRESVDERDAVARLGGDEFALLLGSEAVGTTALGTMLIRRVSVSASVAAGRQGITASIGFARLTPDATAEELFAAADRALYAAKRAGKARCVEAMPVATARGAVRAV